jgi:hypothetical protein
MARSGPEVADIFRRYGAAYRDTHGASLCTAQRRVMSAIELCRTAALGGHVEHCDRCDHQRICYNSCRDRHCPKCQALARAQWLEDRRSELLDTQYFHVVFTVPQTIATIALQNKEIVYNILFRAAGETLRTIAADPKHLGAQLGFFAVLHTWGQALFHHPHLHCVVPGGGISPDGKKFGRHEIHRVPLLTISPRVEPYWCAPRPPPRAIAQRFSAMARSCRSGMSAVRSLTGVDRKWLQRVKTVLLTQNAICTNRCTA